MKLVSSTIDVDVEHNGISMPCRVVLCNPMSKVFAWGGMGPEITFESHPIQFLTALKNAARQLKE